MSLKTIILQEINLYLEGKAEDLVTKFPELQPAYDAGIKNPQYLQWIQKRRGGEPVEDIIGVVQAFDAAKQRLKAKKMSPDIYAYKTPATLRQALEDLGGSKGQERRRLKDEETTYLGEFGNWIVAMPHTRESSCQLGKGTTWCTAATQSQNLFLSYVARKEENIVLYYIIEKGEDPRQDPTAKLSVGFINGEPVLDGEHGGISVDARNDGLDEDRLSQILGYQFEPIMDAMRENASSIGGKHPAKKQMEKIVKNPVAFEKAIANMGKEEKRDFVRNAFEYDVSPKTLVKLADDEDEEVKTMVARNASTPPEVLVKLSGDFFPRVRRAVAANPSTPSEELFNLAGDKSFWVRETVAKSRNAPPELLTKLSEDLDSRIRRLVGQNPSTPIEVLVKLSNDKDSDVRERVAKNPSTPIGVLTRFFRDVKRFREDRGVAISLASNPSIPLKMLVEFSKDIDGSIRARVAENPSTPPELLATLFGDNAYAVMMQLAENPNTPPEVLAKFKARKLDKFYPALAKNPSTPIEILIYLSKLYPWDDWLVKILNNNPTYVAYKKEQGLNESQIKELAREELKLFLEGKAEDLVSKFPELQPAYDAGIKNPQYLQWIQKRRGGEPVEDVIGVVQSFDRSKQRLKAKRMSPDIYAYKTPAVLRQTLEDLGGSKGSKTRRLKDEETTYLGTFGDWVVAMPHTRESSCQLGKGTTWCTAATQSQNLFLSYVGSKDKNIILYYVMKKGSDPRQDPTAKLSVGFVNGEPVLDGEDGHISVDAKNKGLDQRRLSQILGDQLEPIMTTMKEHASSIAGKHPAKKQIEQIAKSKDPSKVDKYTQSMGEEERIDFLELVLDANPSPQILVKLSGDEDGYVRSMVARNPSTPPEVLVKLSNDDEDSVRSAVASHPSTPPEILSKLSNDENYIPRMYVAKNPSTPPEILSKLSDDVHPYVRKGLAINPSTPPEILSKLSSDKHRPTRKWVARNPSTPIEALLKLSGDEVRYVRSEVARNPNFIAYKNKQGIAEASTYGEGTTMQFTEEYIRQVIKEEYEALLDEKKKKPCKPAKGKRFAKRVNGKCRSYGQAGQAKGGGDRIRPGTKKGDAYCARSAKIKKCKSPPCANDLSRKKWKCRGSKSMK